MGGEDAQRTTMLKRWFWRRRRLNDAQLGREYRVDDVIDQRYEVQQVRRGYMGVVYIAYLDC